RGTKDRDVRRDDLELVAVHHVGAENVLDEVRGERVRALALHVGPASIAPDGQFAVVRLEWRVAEGDQRCRGDARHGLAEPVRVTLRAGENGAWAEVRGADVENTQQVGTTLTSGNGTMNLVPRETSAASRRMNAFTKLYGSARRYSGRASRIDASSRIGMSAPTMYLPSLKLLASAAATSSSLPSPQYWRIVFPFVEAPYTQIVLLSERSRAVRARRSARVRSMREANARYVLTRRIFASTSIFRFSRRRSVGWRFSFCFFFTKRRKFPPWASFRSTCS